MRSDVPFSAAALERELAVALEAAHDAASVLLRHFHGKSESWEKSEDNPVTQADLESDRAISARLRAAFPDDGLLSEETVSERRGARRRAWIVDPMDGTKEFVARIPEFAVSIALVEAGDPILGVILNPAAGVAVAATRGGGAWRAPWSPGAGLGARERARVSACARLEDAVVIASRTEISRGKFEPYAGWFRELRAVGSIAWKLGCIACGDGDLNVSVAPKNEWDVCAGDVLVREAGGDYVDFAGVRRRYDQPDPLIEAFMAAGPPALLEAFRKREHDRAA